MPNKKRYCAQLRATFESRISAGGTEKLPCSENFRISSWSSDMEGRAKKCVERYCELANKSTQQLYKVSTPCIDDHHLQRKIEICRRTVTSMLSNCSEMFFLARFGKTWYGQWVNLHDRLQNGPKLDDQFVWCGIVMWVLLQKACMLGLFQDSDFAGRSWGLKITSGGTLLFWSHTFCSNELYV